MSIRKTMDRSGKLTGPMKEAMDRPSQVRSRPGASSPADGRAADDPPRTHRPATSKREHETGMPMRLSRALARVLPALILLVVGLVAALFTGRRTPRPSVPAPAVPAPVMSAGRVPGLHRWGPAIVFASLLLGGGGILALLSDDEGESPVTVLSQPEIRAAVGSPGEPGRAANGTATAPIGGGSTAMALADANGPAPDLPAGNGATGLRDPDERGDIAVAPSPLGGSEPPGMGLAEPKALPVPRAASESPTRHDPAPDAARANIVERPATGDPSGAAPDATRILGVEAGSGGRLSVTARATAGSSVRLYLNETLVAPARIGRDGLVAFVIGGGVKPGAYEVRLDQVDAASGAVRSRVEVPVSVPDADRAAATEAAHASHTPEADPAIVFVPEVRTARIVPGDSLWAISRKTYGEGDRYTAIFDANQDQIRDPDLIYPGQVFVLPSEEAGGAGRVGTTDRGASN